MHRRPAGRARGGAHRRLLIVQRLGGRVQAVLGAAGGAVQRVGGAAGGVGSHAGAARAAQIAIGRGALATRIGRGIGVHIGPRGIVDGVRGGLLRRIGLRV